MSILILFVLWYFNVIQCMLVLRLLFLLVLFFFFKQKTAYEMRISDWSSDVCSSDLKGDGSQQQCSRNRSDGTRDIRDLSREPAEQSCPTLAGDEAKDHIDRKSVV